MIRKLGSPFEDLEKDKTRIVQEASDMMSEANQLLKVLLLLEKCDVKYSTIEESAYELNKCLISQSQILSIFNLFR